MPSLLDLEDETLRLIGQYTNKDAHIPLPSFGPHWENFRSEISHKAARDLLSFRSTCKRVNGVCRLEGLHLRITKWQKMSRWMSNAPREVEQAIRRIHICLPVSDSARFSSFFGLTTFLHRFDNLEELIIHGCLSCSHMYGYSQDPSSANKLRLPEYSFLSNLKSLSVDVICPFCSQDIPKLLVPPAPRMKHLKISLAGCQIEVPPNGLFGTGSPISITSDAITCFQEILEEWSKKNNGSRLDLRTLQLRYPPRPEDGTEDGLGCMIQKVFEFLPNLEEFGITRFDGEQEDLVAGFIIVGRQKSTWQFQMKDLEIDGDSPSSIHELISTLHPPPSLKRFDPVIVFKTHLTQPYYRSVSSFQTRSDFYSHRKSSMKSHRQSSLVYENSLKEGMTAAAKALLEMIPSLERGSFWEQGTEWSKKDWNLWEWENVTDVTGISRPFIADVPIRMSKDFVSCQDRRTIKIDGMGMAYNHVPMQVDADGEEMEDEGHEDGEDLDDDEGFVGLTFTA
ncbi:uncharacterized protein IL334_007155 [Kwoniella shivajii]|uniref:F-box domain-containing protein n=1 Tax=Kwoniella shivajii TaxID=564305 RepID=A0ABZ1DB18_9TREE|nr:hypothetical protein IL334_007155 [Kwoniella shivajii]